MRNKAMALLLAGLLAACAASERPEAGGEPFLDPSAVREMPDPQIAPALLREVRTARHPGFDRVTFEFSGDRLPGYKVAYLAGPAYDCGAGEPKEVAGSAVLEVDLRPANAHTEEGQPTIPFRERPLDLPVLKEIERTCDFEAVVTWALGVAGPKRFRVMELSGPPRLAIDVEH
jgi:hypothetical protein